MATVKSRSQDGGNNVWENSCGWTRNAGLNFRLPSDSGKQHLMFIMETELITERRMFANFLAIIAESKLELQEALDD